MVNSAACVRVCARMCVYGRVCLHGCVYACTAAKMGLYGFFSSLATEVSKEGVTVTICCPGPVAAAPGAPPRAVYGPTGIKKDPPAESGKPDKARMSPEVSARPLHYYAAPDFLKQPVYAYGHAPTRQCTHALQACSMSPDVSARFL